LYFPLENCLQIPWEKYHDGGKLLLVQWVFDKVDITSPNNLTFSRVKEVEIWVEFEIPDELFSPQLLRRKPHPHELAQYLMKIKILEL
jgi:hypothetical protein